MSSGRLPLAEGFRERLASLGAPREEDAVIVAVSGGLDSVVLLHLLRFAPGVPALDLTVAHVDHRMREGSRGDAAWVRGLTLAWEVPLAVHTLDEPPSGETRARGARYQELEAARTAAAAAWIVTAHHADDQAETVLFRALRGTGPRGLAGIPPVDRRRRLLRPLLPWWREELEAYALEHRLSWRIDPTNADVSVARNAIRQELLPLAEERVAPGARRALARLARVARRDQAAFGSLLEPVLEGVVEESAEDRIVVVRSRLLTYHPGVRARALRTLVRRLGPSLDEAGTRLAMQFTSSGASGRGLTLPRGVTLTRDFDRLVLTRETPGPGGEDDRPATGEPGGSPEVIHIRTAETGEASLALGGRAWLARWSSTERPSGRWVARFDPSDLAFPLRLRGWSPGDRLRLDYGSKKVVKLFAEARVPAAERSRRPVLEDGAGRLVWVPGVARENRGQDPQAELDEAARNAFTIAIDDADD